MLRHAPCGADDRARRRYDVPRHRTARQRGHDPASSTSRPHPVHQLPAALLRPGEERRAARRRPRQGRPRGPRRRARRRRARRRADPRDRVRAPRRRPRAAPRHRDLQRRRGAVDPAALQASRRGARRRARSRSPTPRARRRCSRASCSRSAGASTPTTSRCRPTCRAMLRDADAALLIGDDALRAYWEHARGPARRTTSAPSGRRGPACRWSTPSGRSAASSPRRSPTPSQRVADALNGSLAYCRAHLDDISEYAARWESFPAEQFRSYFDALQFRFEPRYREGLTRYLDRGARASASSSACRDLAVFGERRVTRPHATDAAAALAFSAARGELRLTRRRRRSRCCAHGDLLDARRGRQRHAPPPRARARRHVHRRPQRQLHQRLRLAAAASARSTATPTTPTPTS